MEIKRAMEVKITTKIEKDSFVETLYEHVYQIAINDFQMVISQHRGLQGDHYEHIPLHDIVKIKIRLE